MNTDELAFELYRAERRVREIQTKLHRWRAINAPHLVALVRAGARFENGKLVERPDDDTTTKEAA